MTASQIVPHRTRDVPFGLAMRVRLASLLAVAVARLSPARIRGLLNWLRRGARPASYERAAQLRDATVEVSLSAAGPEGCLRRTLTVVLVCRSHGIWATWCVGVTRLPPFRAHSWIEAEGRVVGEDVPASQFCTLIALPARAG